MSWNTTRVLQTFCLISFVFTTNFLSKINWLANFFWFDFIWYLEAKLVFIWFRGELLNYALKRGGLIVIIIWSFVFILAWCSVSDRSFSCISNLFSIIFFLYYIYYAGRGNDGSVLSDICIFRIYFLNMRCSFYFAYFWLMRNNWAFLLVKDWIIYIWIAAWTHKVLKSVKFVLWHWWFYDVNMTCVTNLEALFVILVWIFFLILGSFFLWRVFV